MKVHISPGNKKMGSIPSVSLPSIITCRRDAPCFVKCYANRLEKFRTSVHDSYVENYELWLNDPDIYWREVEGAVMMNRFFRFHVSGDIPDSGYFLMMLAVANRNPHCELLCFTKKYEIVNECMAEFYEHTKPLKPILPPNLHILFSVWKGLKCPNPWGFPEAHIAYKDGTTTAQPGYKMCGGNCTECAKTSGGCWTLGNGERIVIREH